MTGNSSTSSSRKPQKPEKARKLPEKWLGKPYYSLDAYCKNTFQRKCFKIALKARMTCPNRDGTLGSRGCIFCSQGGSGEFAMETAGKGDIAAQLQAGFALIAKKLPPAGTATAKPGLSATPEPELPSTAEPALSVPGSLYVQPCIIAYFQAYTNTYAPLHYLEQIFSEALDAPFVLGISIATRPDCLPPQVLELLAGLKNRYPDKFIWVELGLQTIHDKTAAYIRRGYPLSCFDGAVKNLQAINIPVIVHMILGLPGEGPSQMLETISYLNAVNPFGVKLQLLHVLEDTDLAAAYRNGEFSVLTLEGYLDILISCLEHLSPDVIVHRVTGDGPKKILIAPDWSGDKKKVLNTLHHLMRERESFQGRCLKTC